MAETMARAKLRQSVNCIVPPLRKPTDGLTTEFVAEVVAESWSLTEVLMNERASSHETL
jgi:hypothetical protein